MQSVMPHSKHSSVTTPFSHRARKAVGSESCTAALRKARYQVSREGRGIRMSVFSTSNQDQSLFCDPTISYKSKCLKIIRWKAKLETSDMPFSER